MEIEYSDGLQTERQISTLLDGAKNLSSDFPIAIDQYQNWPVRYHLSPERANLLRHLDFEGLEVLEVGAGTGAVSRFLSERAQHLTVIEGTQSRFDALSKRLRDRGNWTGIVGNLQDVALDKKFDVICVVGVLEYAELYLSAGPWASPFHAFLEQTKKWLKPEGVLILAIENRLGMKYWSGAAEDHTGRLFDGVCGYSLEKSAKTFSRRELLQIFRDVGFSKVEEYFPFPDYKVPASILSRKMIDEYPEVSAFLANTREFENYGEKRVHYFSDLLATQSVSKAGLLDEFSNSFLFVASGSDSKIFRQLNRRQGQGEVAWHYSLFRRERSQTVFQVDKDGLYSLKGEKREPVLEGLPVRFVLEKKAYFEGENAVMAELRRFLSFGLSSLKPESLDAVYTNAVVDETGYRLFDLEWKYEGDIPPSYFIFRNCLKLVEERVILSKLTSYSTLRDLYESLCREFGVTPAFENDCEREATFQASATFFEESAQVEAIRKAMTKRIRKIAFPQSLRREAKFEKVKMLLKMLKESFA